MATLDLSRATARIDMTNANLVKFGTAEFATADSWSFNNGRSDDLQLDGKGMTFDSKGHALTGTVSRIGIDLGDNDFDNPDILITGISASAKLLDDGAGTFWSTVLAGNDTIIGSDRSVGAAHVIFGDGPNGKPGSSTGGSDTILTGAAVSSISGDVQLLGSQTVGAAAMNYTGGADTITGQSTGNRQTISGDVEYVLSSGTLNGGADTITIRSQANSSVVTGDAYYAQGIAGRTATVNGGNDTIIGSDGSAAQLVGDVYEQVAYAFVKGGNDVISGSDMHEQIYGDVRSVGNNNMVGGHDKIWGNGGDDKIIGDFYSAGGQVTAGNDTIYGGLGNDQLLGDGMNDAKSVGGNDRLYGEAGNDSIWGGTGNDLLDGGIGDDKLTGGSGNDTYIVNSLYDVVTELANEGNDTIVTDLMDVALGDNVENLTYNGVMKFIGAGNALANVLKGSLDADYLQGMAGNDKLIGGAQSDSLYGGANDDVLVGGAGADLLDGEMGFDIASYEGSERGVNVSLDGSVTATGDAVGDTFMLVEGLRGTSYNDVLVGNKDANKFEGGAGDDVLSGLAGADILIGGSGRDKMAGGADADSFVFTAITDSGITATTRDIITDFTRGSDKIDLLAIDANTATAANDVFQFLAKGTATSSVGTGKIGWYQENLSGTANDKTILRINNDADAAIDMTIEIKGLVSFTAADFLL